MKEPYILSIETDAGTYQHGFHLGTEPMPAQQIAEEAFHCWAPRQGTQIKTVALKQNGKLCGVYNGEWDK